MSWSRRSRNALRFSRAEWARLVAGWHALLWAEWQLRRHPLPEVIARLRAAASSRAATTHPEPWVRGVQRAAVLFPVPMLCLPQSVALARLLLERGQECSLLVGAKSDGETLDAHAWIEIDGVPINSAPDSAEQHPVWLHETFTPTPATLRVG